SRRGATIGHKYANCRVIDLRTGDNPSFWRAWGRFWVKGVAGVLAFIFMPLTRRHQALHDIMFGTAVVIADPTTAESWQYVRERTPDALYVPVPVWRRMAVIAGYSVAGFLSYGAVLLLVQSPACINLSQCTGADDLRSAVFGYAWVGSQLLWIILGWLGRLPGARAKRAGPTSPEPRAA
ncbi:MAG TPA: RDD family protein, partial [Sphingomicrobium sp.]|nr:RDD family protein [Sphingomicrobium sp.]